MQLETQECHVTKTGYACFCHMTFQPPTHITQKVTEMSTIQIQTQECHVTKTGCAASVT